MMRKTILLLAVTLLSISAYGQTVEVSKVQETDSLKPAIQERAAKNIYYSLKAHAMQDSSSYAGRLIRAAADPSSAVEGQLYENSVSHVPKFFNGTSWLTLQTTATTPGGSNGQLQINNSGAFGGITLGGDCAFASPSITCTKTNGVSFAAVATSGSKSDVGLSVVDNTSDADKPVSTAQQTALNLKENSANKDATGGYAGLTLFKINFKNAANTFTSFFTNSNTAARTYTFQDRDGTIADNTVLARASKLRSV
jgi:hypothetical protein